MATVTELDCVEQIGQIAGEVWHCLSKNDRMSFAKLAKAVGGPRDIVMQAVGWLAREGKLEIEETSRGRFVRLRD